MQVFVLDLGSNSFQVQLFSVEPQLALGQGFAARRLQGADGPHAEPASTELAVPQVQSVERRRSFFQLGTRRDDRQGFSEHTIAASCACVRQLMDGIPNGMPGVGIATAAIRDARNGQQLVAALRARLGIPISVLAGEQEALLAYRGAWLDLDPLPHGEPTAIVDIGGGSTEIAMGCSRAPQTCTSLRLGALDFQGFGKAGFSAARCAVSLALNEALASCGQGMPAARRLAFACGVARTLRKLAEALRITDGERDMTPETLHNVNKELLARSPAELVLAGCPERRAETMGPVSSLMLELALRSEARMISIVDTGVREGAALALAETLGRDSSPMPATLASATCAAPGFAVA